MDIAVIGAGIAGLTAAGRLRERGARVVVFEKARGAGGRMSTRRHTAGVFDHGAQYFTAREEMFRAEVGRWEAAGVAERWDGRIVDLAAGAAQSRPASDVRFVGRPGMSSICRHLARDLDVRFGCRVGKLARRRGGWWLDGAGPFDTVLVTAPAPQAAMLLAAVPDLARRLEVVTLEPCLAAMLVLPESFDPGFDGAFVQDSPLAWIGRRRGGWVLHATPEWSRAHFDEAPEEAGLALHEALRGALRRPLAPPSHLSVHRWRFARVATPLGEASLWDERARAGAAGDGCLGARVECAFLSGADLAGRVRP